MGVAVGDANGDSRPDLFVTDLGGPDLLLSDAGGGWYDATLAMGADLGEDPDRMVSWGARFVDVDGDGRDDIPVAFGRGDPAIQADVALVNQDWEIAEDQRDALLLATDDGFSDVGDALGVAAARHRGLVTLDLDGDHAPEVVAAGKSDLTVYRYGGGCPSRGAVYVYGDDTRPAIGARVTVHGERDTTRWVLPSATESASGNVVFVGMGHADAVEVEVAWPNGGTAHFTLPAGRAVRAYPEGQP
jgi:enediyne biosynthesis protein E4